jgi:hypothetical protein
MLEWVQENGVKDVFRNDVLLEGAKVIRANDEELIDVGSTESLS